MGPCEAAPTPTWQSPPLPCSDLRPLPSPPCGPRAGQLGAPGTVMMQINTFIFLRKSEPPPSLAGAGRVLCVPPARRGPHPPTASVNTILNKS